MIDIFSVDVIAPLDTNCLTANLIENTRTIIKADSVEAGNQSQRSKRLPSFRRRRPSKCLSRNPFVLARNKPKECLRVRLGIAHI